MNRQKLLSVALLVSIAANLFLIGGITYRVLSFREMPDARPLPPNVGWLVRDLSEERRAELAPILRETGEQIRPTRREMFRAMSRVNQLMAANEFDSSALAEAFAELRSANDRYQTLSHQQTVSILAQLTDAERQAAREFVRRRGPRDGRDRDRDGEPRFRPDGNRPPPPPRPDL